MNKKAGVVFLAITLPLVSCGGYDSPQSSDQKVKPSIIDGTPSKLGDRPYQVSVLTSSGGGIYSCGGTILSKKWILTAAHCVNKGDSSDMAVRAGSLEDRKGGQKITPKRTIIHPEYKGGFDANNDIALIELESDLEFNEFVSAAALPTKAIEQKYAKSGSMLIISGWGHVSRDPITKPSDLREASLKVMTQEACQKAFPNARAEKLICGEKNLKGQAGCYGDSGGPFASKENGRHFVFGTASTAEKEDCSAATAFSRTSAFQGWITQVTGIQPDHQDSDPPQNKVYEGRVNMNSSSFQPNSKGFDWEGGLLKATLSSSARGDFDLYLQKKEGVRWVDVDSSNNEDHSESIEYNAASGKYRWEVYAYEGEGSYKITQSK